MDNFPNGNLTKADLVLYGHVITLDNKKTTAEAVASKDGKIIFIGSKSDAENYIDKKTKVVDYQDNYIYPGFVDGHAHPSMMGAGLSSGCLCTNDDTAAQTIAKLNRYIAAHPDKAFYSTYGSYASLSQGKHHFTCKMLDEKVRLNGQPLNRPLIVIDASGHSGCLNSAALNFIRERFLITDDAKFVKDNDFYDMFGLEDYGHGPELDGNVCETPFHIIALHIPRNIEEVKSSILNTQKRLYLPTGYTTIGDCTIINDSAVQLVEAMYQLAVEGKLKYKVRSFFLIDEISTASAKEQIQVAIEMRKKYSHEFFKIVGVKLFIDGTTEKYSAYTTENYVDNPFERYYPQGYRGIFRWRESLRHGAPSMAELIVEANKNDLAVDVHAYGDGAVRFALNEFGKAYQIYPYNRNSIAHCAYIRDEDVPLFEKYHVTPLVAPHWSVRKQAADRYEEEIYGKYDPQNPDKRSIQRGYLIKSLFGQDNHNRVSFHTDGMCPEGVPYMIYAAVNRVDPDNADPTSPNYLGPRDAHECITPDLALRALTRDPAYLLFEENNIGVIEVGRAADFSIYPCDFTDPKTTAQTNYKVSKTPVIATYVNGKIMVGAHHSKKLNIVKDNNPSLRNKSVDVTLPISKEDEETITDMMEYLKNSQNENYRKTHPEVREGIGLAAPQIGINKKMIVVHLTNEDGVEISHALVNPKIVSTSAKQCYLKGGEGCLSVDETHDGYVFRHYAIRVEGYDALLKQNVSFKAQGLEAIVLQHEIDHLSGILYYDRINKLDPLSAPEDFIAL
ncbi:MAG: peptide deformylase [Bacilli bacterium]|nr:peptide deformylase [Bacilli bacterium]